MSPEAGGSIKPCEEPIRAAFEHGEVVPDGLDGLAASPTLRAALVSAERLPAAADTAERDPAAEGE